MAPGPWQILIIVLVLLLLFGAGKLPRIMEDMAKGIKSFKKGMKDDENDSNSPQNKPIPSIPDQKHSTQDAEIIEASVEPEDEDQKAKSE